MGDAFVFDRYVNGVLMAEGVTIERARSVEDAMRVAAELASRGPNGEAPVLVLAASSAPSLPEDVERVVEPCACHRCHKPVAYDLIISDDDWAKIAPKSVDGWKGGGILCPDCIYAALSSQLAEVRAERDHWQKLHDDRTRFLGDAEAERDRLAAENEAFRAALEGIAAPAIFFLSREDAIKMRNQARAALASLEDR